MCVCVRSCKAQWAEQGINPAGVGGSIPTGVPQAKNTSTHDGVFDESFGRMANTNVHDTVAAPKHNTRRQHTSTHAQARLTEALSGGGVEEKSVLAARPAVAALQGGQRGAGGAVGLGGAGAGLTGRVACWEGGGQTEERQGTTRGKSDES